MMTKRMTRLIYVLAGLLIACSDHDLGFDLRPADVGVAVAPSAIAGNVSANAGPTPPVSGGANTWGVVIPGGAGVTARIKKGLENKATATQGNFAKGVQQVATNLPKVTNVMNAS